MMYKCERYVPNYRCSDCAYSTHCRCFDNTKLVHYAPYFSSTHGGFPCKFFEPSVIHVFDLAHYWTDYNTWYKEWVEEWNNGKPIKEDERVWMQIVGHEHEFAVAVKFGDYVNGNIMDGNKLKAFVKRYYRHKKDKPVGLEMVYEGIDGVEVV